MRTIKRDDGQATQLPYFFRFRRPTASSPTVILIPGGPGQGTIDFYDPQNPDAAAKRFGIPDGFGLIQTDPRFAEQNYSADYKNYLSAISTEGVVEDLVQLVSELKLTNYILYGISYGTVPATIMGARRDVSPAAVVLEGVLGKVDPATDLAGDYGRQWSAFIKTVDPKIRDAFIERTNRWIAAGSFSGDEFGKILAALLIAPHSPGGESNLESSVNFIATADEEKALAGIRKFKDELEKSDRASGQEFFHDYVSCRELSSGFLQEPSFRDNQIFAINGKTTCSDYGLPPTAPGYDSAKYQIRSPIFYISGEVDPATPREQAEYHFSHQRGLMKYFIGVPRAGHTPLLNDLWSCSPEFWQLVAINPKFAVQSLDRCMPVIN